MKEIKMLNFLRITKSEYKYIPDDCIQLAEMVDDVSTELLDAYEKEPEKSLAVRILGSKLFTILTDSLKQIPSFTNRVTDVVSELENAPAEQIKEIVEETIETQKKKDEDILDIIDNLEL